MEVEEVLLLIMMIRVFSLNPKSFRDYFDEGTVYTYQFMFWGWDKGGTRSQPTTGQPTLLLAGVSRESSLGRTARTIDP
jgi:hypothetical protein